MIHRDEIHIRDPFILPDLRQGVYYMYGTNGGMRQGNSRCFLAYKTRDLEHFEEPVVVFDAEAVGFWADRDFWAPEVHFYDGRYCLFASFRAHGRHRCTQILVSDSPEGPFRPISDGPVTPAEWDCLDGTLWVEDGTPYIVFCHEWSQVGDGEILAMPLTADLTAPAGAPTLLFRASDSPYANAYPKEGCFVTDGPFLFREDGKLKMIWSSFFDRRYVVLEAESESGSVLGPWTQQSSRFSFDGGHAMIFETFEGERMIALHSPNASIPEDDGKERPVFLRWTPA